jgi:hypothetical protein
MPQSEGVYNYVNENIFEAQLASTFDQKDVQKDAFRHF